MPKTEFPPNIVVMPQGAPSNVEAPRDAAESKKQPVGHPTDVVTTGGERPSVDAAARVPATSPVAKPQPVAITHPEAGSQESDMLIAGGSAALSAPFAYWGAYEVLVNSFEAAPKDAKTLGFFIAGVLAFGVFALVGGLLTKKSENDSQNSAG